MAEDKQEEEPAKKKEEEEDDPYPTPDLGDFNERAFKYPKKGTNLGFIRYWPKDDSIYLTYDDPTYPREEGDIAKEYKLIQESNQRKRRLLLGAFLDGQRPQDERFVEQFLVDMAEPLPFDEFYDDVEKTAEGDALFEALDMAQSVMAEGGACIECDAEADEDGNVDHKVGCRVISWIMWRMVHPEEQDRQPSMAMVIKAAEDQIARMA